MRFHNDLIAEAVRPNYVGKEKSLDFLDYSDQHGAYINAMLTYRSTPGLRGFWPFFNTSESGAPASYVLSLSGVSGVPQWTVDGVLSYGSFAAANDRALTSTDTVFNVGSAASWSSIPGLFLCSWVRFDSNSAEMGIISNWDAFNSRRSYVLWRNSSNQIGFAVSSDGTSANSVTTTGTTTNDVWYFVAGRWTPSTEIKVWLYDTSSETTEVATNTSSIAASVYSPSPVAYAHGRYTNTASGTDYKSLDGDMCFSLYSVNAIPDHLVHRLRVVSEPYIIGARAR